MTAEVMMKEYKNMKKELTVTEFQLRQFQDPDSDRREDCLVPEHRTPLVFRMSTVSKVHDLHPELIGWKPAILHRTPQIIFCHIGIESR